METNECIVCGEVKNVTEFYKRGTDIDGNVVYRNICKECSKQQSKLRAEAHREELKEYHRNWRKEKSYLKLRKPYTPKYGVDEEGNIRCSKCGEFRPRSAFYFKYDRYPLMPCKQCRSEHDSNS